jgi:predicted DNA-binding ArsR family transcriptional regulator
MWIYWELYHKINIITIIDIILIIWNCLENGLIPIKKFDKKNTIVQINICITVNKSK